MTSTYSNSLRLNLQGTGDNNNDWGEQLNSGLTLLDKSVGGMVDVSMTPAGDITLTTANGAEDQARYAILRLTGAIIANKNLIIPGLTKTYIVKGAWTGAYTVTVKTASGNGVTISTGQKVFLYCDGTDVFSLSTDALYATTGGSANAYTATVSGVGSLSSPFIVYVSASFTNTGASTLNINGLGAKAILTAAGDALVAGDIQNGGTYQLLYDGTQFKILSVSKGSRLLAGDGSAGTPSYSFGSATTTGFYLNSGNIAASLAGVERLNLGTSVLTYTGVTAVDAILKINQIDSGNSASASLDLQKAGTSKLRLTTMDAGSTLWIYNGTAIKKRADFNIDGTTYFYDEAENKILTLSPDQTATFESGLTVKGALTQNSGTRIIASGLVKQSSGTGSLTSGSNISSTVAYSETTAVGRFDILFSSATTDTNYNVIVSPPANGTTTNASPGSQAVCWTIANKTTTGFSIYMYMQTNNNTFAGFRPTDDVGFVVERWS